MNVGLQSPVIPCQFRPDMLFDRDVLQSQDPHRRVDLSDLVSLQHQLLQKACSLSSAAISSGGGASSSEYSGSSRASGLLKVACFGTLNLPSQPFLVSGPGELVTASCLATAVRSSFWRSPAIDMLSGRSGQLIRLGEMLEREKSLDICGHLQSTCVECRAERPDDI